MNETERANMATRIWYVEDDAAISDSVVEHLRSQDFETTVFSDGVSIRNALPSQIPDLLLLDWNLPDDSGTAICKWARKLSDELPIMILSVRDDSADIVDGLQSGADDYVTKPFALEVLTMRIRALLRRSQPSSHLSCGEIELDQDRGIAYLGKERLQLTALEFRLLQLFMQNKGRLVSRERIRSALWESNGESVSDNTMTVAIKRLREKLGKANCLRTVRSFGYRLEEPL